MQWSERGLHQTERNRRDYGYPRKGPASCIAAALRLHQGCTWAAPHLHRGCTSWPLWRRTGVAVRWHFLRRVGHSGVLRRGLRLRADRSVSLQDSVIGPCERRGPGAEEPRERWRSGGGSVALRWRLSAPGVAVWWRPGSGRVAVSALACWLAVRRPVSRHCDGGSDDDSLTANGVWHQGAQPL
jgi:hypothetical protein